MSGLDLLMSQGWPESGFSVSFYETLENFDLMKNFMISQVIEFDNFFLFFYKSAQS